MDIKIFEFAIFNMSILFENLANSPILAKLDPKIVDQSTYLRI